MNTFYIVKTIMDIDLIKQESAYWKNHVDGMV